MVQSPKGFVGLQMGTEFSVKTPANAIADYIAFLRAYASNVIECDGGDPSQYKKIYLKDIHAETAGRAFWAAQMLVTLDKIERRMSLIQSLSDTDQVRDHALPTIYHALCLASQFHQLTIADNEPQIDHSEKVRRKIRPDNASNVALHAERAFEWRKWNKCAAPKWAGNASKARRSKLDVAALVKKDLGLTEKATTIAKKLKRPGTAY
jgi:hypothetical protein